MPIAMRARTSRSRSSIRWERKVSWPSDTTGSLAKSARRLVARRGLLDAELELRRSLLRGRRRRLVGGLRAGVDGALEGSARFANLPFGLGDLRLDLGLEGTRGALKLGLHLAQFGDIDLAVDIRLDLGHVALQPPVQGAEGACDARQAFGPDHHQCDDADQEKLGKPEVEHELGARHEA